MTDLREVLARMNAEQEHAIHCAGNVVVLAGPGSGKTDTLAAKVVRLMRDEVPPPRGVACITYNNEAVREFTNRLRDFGLQRERRLFLGTVHGFCLTRVLRPYASLVGEPHLADPVVISQRAESATLRQAFGNSGLTWPRSDPRSTITRIRRSLGLDEDTTGFDASMVSAAREYDAILLRESLVDFESMTLHALRLMDTHSVIREFLAARYPWLAVDEYQDLGGPLHRIVQGIRSAGSRVFAVGDPDQCIYGFTGASPAYLEELVADPAFETVRLRFNYRSGSALISAAEASLGATRSYAAAPERTDEGNIYFQEVSGGLRAQAEWIANELVPSLVASGTVPHEIAILYKQQGPFLAGLKDVSASHPFAFERNTNFPDARVIKWLQRCAARATGIHDVDSISDLAFTYRDLLERANRNDDELALRSRLVEICAPVDSQTPLDHWLVDAALVLDLDSVLAADAGAGNDIEALAQLRGATAGVTVSEFANNVQARGRVVVTTCHSAKGRQFDVVILPALQKRLFPFERWTGSGYQLDAESLAEDRRLFYVGLTRARHQVHLVYSPTFHNAGGYPVHGRSQFVDEVEERIAVA